MGLTGRVGVGNAAGMRHLDGSAVEPRRAADDETGVQPFEIERSSKKFQFSFKRGWTGEKLMNMFCLTDGEH